MSTEFPAKLKQYYADEEYIGGGGFASVFRATRDGEKVAVKIPAIISKKTGEYFLRELKNWSELEHGNIVKLNTANTYPVPYLEMELCDGSLDYGNKSVKQSALIIYEVAKGLKHAHEREKPIVHGDLKHSNILIKDGKYKIADWGLSKIKKGRSLSISALTPEFAAPEQILGKMDERTDIWQLGVIFYELVTGKLPFESKNEDEVINAIINDNPVPVSEINHESKCIEQIIDKCLKKKREERYQSVDEILKELEKFLGLIET